MEDGIQMTDRVKIYEEKKKGAPVWAWLLPLLLVVGLLAYFLTRHHPDPQQASATPDLGTVYFDTNQAVLTADDQQTLQRAAATMKQNPNVHMRLEGFTDSTGSSSQNATLSERRATSVADYLQTQGIDRKRLTGGGNGASHPADTNASEQGKAENRRVELFSQQ